MERIEYRSIVDKFDWRPGEWSSEPDKIQWQDEATGLPCLIVRGPLGALCGYVGVQLGHPLHGVSYSDCRYGQKCPEKKGDENYSYCDHRPESFLDAHGGVTFAGGCLTPTPEQYEKMLAQVASRQKEATQYPHGDSAKWLKSWTPVLGSFEAYREKAEGASICHRVSDGEPDNVWWFGFDCAHCGDVCPGMSSLRIRSMSGDDGETYKDIAYVADECRKLAHQLSTLS